MSKKNKKKKKNSNNLSANVAQTQTMAEMPNKTFSNT